MGVTSFDHVALPTANAERFLAFYASLGFEFEGVDAWRAGRHPTFSISAGVNKINVHPEAMVAMRGNPIYLRGESAEPGCGDVCFVWEGGIDALQTQLRTAAVEPIEGPIVRAGARGPGVSIYVRDPDDNLLEFMSYDAADLAAMRD